MTRSLESEDTGMALSLHVNPFAQLITPAPVRKPKSTQASIVINGKRVTSMYEVKRMARNGLPIARPGSRRSSAIR